jgi:type III pantothenate kinase
MDKLIIDRGNTNFKLAVFREKSIIASWVKAGLDKKIIGEIFHSFNEISCILYSSVTRDEQGLIDFLKDFSDVLVMDHQLKVPFESKYKTPHTLGYDRMAAIAGAMALYPAENVLAIDAGTCLKFDFVSKEGLYAGGSISPGLIMRYKSLASFTDRLPEVKPVLSSELTGVSTETSVQSGVLNGMICEISGMIERYKQKFEKLQVVLCGGDYLYFDKSLKNDIFVAPNLVLQGLNEILDLNK